jgi:Cu/Ag efflux protein CusF
MKMDTGIPGALWRGALASLCLAVVGCSRGPSLPPPDQTYTLRGRIETVPARDKPASELMIEHEPIPTFVNREGRVVGMNSMVMPFTPAPGVSLEGYKAGDIVEFTFEVRWKNGGSRLTNLRKLPPDTALYLGKK